MAFFNLPSLETRVLFLCEIKGQISDGYWENATPYNHWQFWCMRPNETAVAPDNIGVKNIYRTTAFHDIHKMKKNNYGMTRKDLLDAVAKRMISQVKLYREYVKMFGDECFEMGLPDEPELFDMYVENAADTENYKTSCGYYKNKVDKWESLGITSELLHRIADADTYGMKELKADLRELSKAMKARQK